MTYRARPPMPADWLIAPLLRRSRVPLPRGAMTEPCAGRCGQRVVLTATEHSWYTSHRFTGAVVWCETCAVDELWPGTRAIEP